MSSDLKKYKLDEFAKLVKKQYQPNADEELIYIGLEHIEQQTLRINGYGNSKNVISQKYRFSSGDILFGKLRPYFRKVFRPKFDGVCSTDIWVIKAKKDFDQGFLFYFLANQSFIDACNSGSSGTRMPRADWDHLSETEWELPPLPTQHRIADILSALDDKIELNRQTNDTLEAIAQAIFKEWFVNFNFPGATGEMIESELGMIPKGWRVGKLGEICEFAYGKGLKSEIRVEGKYPVVGSNGIVGTHNDYLVKGPGIVIGRKGTIGEVTWIHQNFFPIDTAFYINDLLHVNNLYFHYFLLKEQNFKKIGSDSAVPGLNRNLAYVSLVVIPAKDVINQFNALTQTIFADIYHYSNESSTLATIRDTLLPKLMKGEIEV